jgi:hypothetical protein
MASSAPARPNVVATAEVAADGDERELLLGPYRKAAGATDSVRFVPGDPRQAADS